MFEELQQVKLMRVFVAVLVIIITVKIHGRHDGMSMKRIRQEVYNSLKQENLITSDKDASGTDTDEISSVEQTTSRSNFAVTDIYSPSTKKKFKMFNKLGQTLAVAADRVKGSTRFNTQDTVIMIQSVGFGGAVTLKGIQADQYVCMKKDTGIMYAAKRKSLECVFMESMAVKGWFQYHAFLHRKDKSKWYLGIDEDGKALDGDESEKTRDATKFIKRGEAEGIGGFGSGRY